MLCNRHNNSPSDTQNIFGSEQVLVTRVPKIIRKQSITRRLEMHQIIPLTPLRPIRQARRSLIRIHRVEETYIIALNRRGRKIRSDSVHLKDI